MFSRTKLILSALFIAALAGACAPAPPPRSTKPVIVKPVAPAPVSMSVMGSAHVSAADMAAWFSKKSSKTPLATVGVRTLATMYLQEGADEGVKGDIAFVQAMLETGWLQFSSVAPPTNNNFAGIGATDGSSTSNHFSDARIGVRAQIQHLRAYADPDVRVYEDGGVAKNKLKHPTVDPRFKWVLPKGKAPSWNDFGNGVWATDPGYAGKIDRLYKELVAFAAARH